MDKKKPSREKLPMDEIQVVKIVGFPYFANDVNASVCSVQEMGDS